MGGNKKAFKGKQKGSNSRHSRARENLEKNRSEELALAVSIIMANLSCDEDFLYLLLGVERWEPINQPDSDQLTHDGSAAGPKVLNIGDIPDEDENAEAENDPKGNIQEIFEKKIQDTKPTGQQQPQKQVAKKPASNKNNGTYGNYNDEQLRGLPEVERVTRLFNLLSHDNIYISEQISILLANVSNSSYFRHIFVTDRCMKSLLKILRD